MQSSAVPAVQVPVTHISVPLHLLASAHDVPSSLAWPQPASISHESAVQTLLSSQLKLVGGVQIPFLHFSSPLHLSASGHGVRSGRPEFEH